MSSIRKISADKFKRHCLALMNEVAETGVELTITKRGNPPLPSNSTFN